MEEAQVSLVVHTNLHGLEKSWLEDNDPLFPIILGHEKLTIIKNEPFLVCDSLVKIETRAITTVSVVWITILIDRDKECSDDMMTHLFLFTLLGVSKDKPGFRTLDYLFGVDPFLEVFNSLIEDFLLSKFWTENSILLGFYVLRNGTVSGSK
jgi:hypothetical protein